VIAVEKKPKRLSSHALGREVVDHYSNLFARRIVDRTKKEKKVRKKQIRKQVIEGKISKGKKVPKNIRAEVEPQNSTDTNLPEISEVFTSDNTRPPGRVIYQERMQRQVRVINIDEVNKRIEEQEPEPEVHDVLGERIQKKAQRILNRKGLRRRRTRKSAGILAKEIEQEIEQEIHQEEQRDLREKVPLRRRRKVIRRKKR